MSLSFPVSVEKNQALFRRMAELQVFENDLKETFICSGGKGGQNVNKVSTAVFIVHQPSALSVKCSIYRTQGLNRFKARVLLCDRISKWKLGEDTPKDKEHLRLIKRKKNKNRKTKKKYIPEIEEA